MKNLCFAVGVMFLGGWGFAGEVPTDVGLPKADLTGGRLLMEVLNERGSTRGFAEAGVSLEKLGGLLWAADGMNRNGAGRTAPSAKRSYGVDVYAVMEKGVYRYDVKRHVLVGVVAGDFRKMAGVQEFVAKAPVSLVFVADLGKYAKGDVGLMWASIEAGAMSQNVALYCASEGLGSVVRTSIKGEEFLKAAGLDAGGRVLFSQTIGVLKAK